SALVITAYVIIIVGFLVFCSEGTYVAWHQFMMSGPMRIFGVLATLAIAAHAWIGLWTIATDYIKPACIRFVFQWVCIAANVTYVLWAWRIFWSS
ncbi:MAG: succinate dehydrogenase, hydrophobic membrane anchor protein, partial [Gammaproteobacteria bacterium]